MNLLRRSFLGFCLLFPALWLTGCGDEQRSQAPQYQSHAQQTGPRVLIFDVHPLHNPQKLHKLYAPLMDYLSQRVPGVRFEFEASTNYANFEEKLRTRRADFALPNPYHAVLARDWGYHALAKMGDDAIFRGIFLVRKDSHIEQPTDLRGKVVSYPAPTALAAALMPQLYLQTHGLDVSKDIQNSYVGSHESSIMNVYLGKSAAGATWPPPWVTFQKEHPKEAAELKLVWQTPSLVNNAIIARNDLPPELVAKVQNVLVHMQDDAEGRAILTSIEVPHFDLADDRTYDVVQRFSTEFSAKVRPL
jgi:phosphonate transport system substrate-binding protein